MITRFKTLNYLLSKAFCILFVQAATTIKAPIYPLKNCSKQGNFKFLEIIIKRMCLNQQLSTNCVRQGLVASPLLPVMDSLRREAGLLQPRVKTFQPPTWLSLIPRDIQKPIK